ncbi:MAG: SDR family oxidoreductase, partial [Flavobacterium sp.]
SGMAGHVAYTYLKALNKYDVIGTTNSNNVNGISLKMNIFDMDAVYTIISNVKPDIIINCIGMLIDSSRKKPDETIYGNAYFPFLLKKIAEEISAKLIHISTDCVFSGKSGKYTETSLKDATDLYGLSKSLGEIIDDKNLTIRTSIIGPELKQKGEGLFHWFMNQKGTINGYKSNIWSGVTTLELAKFLEFIIENPRVGLVHLTNNGAISKFDLLKLFNEIYSKNLNIISDKDYICDKSFLCTDNSLNFTVSSYKTMLYEQKEFMSMHSGYYQHYQDNQ